MDKFAKRTYRQSAPARNPHIGCCISSCPMAGTISESRLHDDPRDAHWYCREHWNLRGEPDKAQQLALEMKRRPRKDSRHWADIEVAKRVLAMPDEDHTTARQFLDQLLASVGRQQ